MSFTQIFGTKAFWVFVALIFIANVFAAFMISGGREIAFLIISDIITLVAYVIAVWLGSQEIKW